MKRKRNLLIAALIAAGCCAGLAGTARGAVIWTAFNDVTYEAGFTHANATTYKTSGGLLKNIGTGANLAVTLGVSASGVSYQSYCDEPASGTDAHNIFSGYVGFRGSNNGGPSDGSVEIEEAQGDYYTLQLSGCDPNMTYNFAGTAVRGDASYTNRWTLMTLLGADSYTSAHSTGSGVIQPGASGLGLNQVAINTGLNHLAGEGYVAQWTDIDPGADGYFEVKSQQYDQGPGSGGSKGYGIHGLRLQEVPEPATLSLLALGAAGLLGRRRSRRRASAR